jgi:hypothetical protein
MKKLLLATAALVALSLPASAAVIGTFGVNPTSAAGAFSNDPNGPGVGGLFTDDYTFELIGGPQFVTVATASNTFALGGITGPFGIQNFAASIFSTGADGLPGGGDDVLKFGPQLATLCASGLCQQLDGNGLLDAGKYFLEVSGNAGALAGYGGNLSVAAVPVPAVGAGLPGVIAGFGAIYAWGKRRARKKAGGKLYRLATA